MGTGLMNAKASISTWNGNRELPISLDAWRRFRKKNWGELHRIPPRTLHLRPPHPQTARIHQTPLRLHPILALRPTSLRSPHPALQALQVAALHRRLAA
uniref:Uncharacterized protein n=1 Tax=Echinococcus granulosus TaxID=6210 RepID=A0A068WDC8_ECHGR|nr:hypothetical protein EgrG_000806100 [Echinococcus granulosus]